MFDRDTCHSAAQRRLPSELPVDEMLSIVSRFFSSGFFLFFFSLCATSERFVMRRTREAEMCMEAHAPPRPVVDPAVNHADRQTGAQVVSLQCLWD